MLIERWLSDQEYNLIEMVGCASFNLIGSQIRSRQAPALQDRQNIHESLSALTDYFNAALIGDENEAALKRMWDLQMGVLYALLEHLYRTEAQPKGKIVTRNFDDEEARE